MRWTTRPQTVGNLNLPGQFQPYRWFPFMIVSTVILENHIKVGATIYLPWEFSLSWGCCAFEWDDSPTVLQFPGLIIRRPMTDQEQYEYDEHCALSGYWDVV